VKNISEKFVGFLFILFGIIISVLVIPLILIFYPFGYFQRKKFERKYSKFLLQNEGKNFFCYNNRKNAKEYIETYILPDLSDRIDIVYLNGKKVESAYAKEFISHALYGLRYYKRFPHLMKIREGKLIDKSVNNIFYTIRNQNKPKEKMLNEMNEFFEIN